MVLDVVLSLFLWDPVFAQNIKCVSIADKFLGQENYGSFYSPRKGVDKNLQKDGSYLFDMPGGKKVTFSSERKELVISSYVAMEPLIFRVAFDDRCEIVSIIGSAFRLPGGLAVPEASVENCKKVRALAPFAPSPNFTVAEQLSLNWCAAYFPEPVKNRGNVDHLPGTPVGPGTPGWDGKKKNTDN